MLNIYNETSDALLFVRKHIRRDESGDRDGEDETSGADEDTYDLGREKFAVEHVGEAVGGALHQEEQGQRRAHVGDSERVDERTDVLAADADAAPVNDPSRTKS